MYKIYINENLLILVNREKAMEMRETSNYLFAPYSGKKKMILSYLDMMEKSDRLNQVALYHYDYELLKNDFKSLLVTVVAAGGIVVNEHQEILSIFRKGNWDLPKGKLEENEGKRSAAIREVAEETGTKNLKIIEKIQKTNHFFRTKDGRRAIKKTHWYLMSTKKQRLTPQHNEDIEKAEWQTLEQFLNTEDPIYRNIKVLLETYKNQLAEKSRVNS